MTTSNLSTVTRIGAGVRLLDTAVPAVVATLPDGFDPKVRGAVVAAVIAWAVPAGEETPAQKTGAKGSQKLTDFGRGVDAVSSAVKRALSADTEKAPVLRATLSGEGGGSVTVDMTSDLGIALLALIQSSDDAA